MRIYKSDLVFLLPSMFFPQFELKHQTKIEIQHKWTSQTQTLDRVVYTVNTHFCDL